MRVAVIIEPFSDRWDSYHFHNKKIKILLIISIDNESYLGENYIAVLEYFLSFIKKL